MDYKEQVIKNAEFFIKDETLKTFKLKKSQEPIIRLYLYSAINLILVNTADYIGNREINDIFTFKDLKEFTEKYNYKQSSDIIKACETRRQELIKFGLDRKISQETLNGLLEKVGKADYNEIIDQVEKAYKIIRDNKEMEKLSELDLIYNQLCLSYFKKKLNLFVIELIDDIKKVKLSDESIFILDDYISFMFNRVVKPQLEKAEKELKNSKNK